MRSSPARDARRHPVVASSPCRRLKARAAKRAGEERD